MFLYLYVYRRLKPNKEKIVETLPSVSLIIAIKNELTNLQEHLESWLTQQYEHYEVIVIDDNSTDGSCTYVQKYIDRYPKLKLISNSQTSGKKGALTSGINCATGQWVLTTDADCKPDGPNWIYDVMCASRDYDVILLYGPYLPLPGFLNKFIRYETWYIAIQYFSFAQLGLPYMGVGRNLAYKKQVFVENNGFNNHNHIRSGDDDLFIVGLGSTYSIGTHLSGFTYSKPARRLSDLVNQKRRHLTTSTSYPIKIQFLLIVIFASQLLFYGVSLGFLFLGQFTILIITLVLIRWMIMLWIGKDKMSLLKEKSLWYWIPVLDLIILLYYCLMGIMMPFKKKTW